VSTCISHNGEFSEHVYQLGGGAAFSCKRCWMFDEEAAMEEIDRLEGDLAVAVREATTARAVLAAVEAALASSEQAVWKVAYAQQHIIDAYHAAAPVQPEEQR